MKALEIMINNIMTKYYQLVKTAFSGNNNGIWKMTTYEQLNRIDWNNCRHINRRLNFGLLHQANYCQKTSRVN